jgi:hypothetical protein
MTYTDEQVAQYFIDYPGLNESQIARVMSERGVSPEQVARVTQADPGYVSQRYNQYLDLVDQARVSTNIPAASSSGLTFLNAPRDTGLRPSSGVTGAGAGVVSPGPPASVNPVSGLSLGAPSNVTVGPQPEPYVDTAAQNLLGQFDQAMDAAMVSGDYANVANVMKEAEGLYGPSAYSAVADYLNTNPRYEGLRGQVGIDPSIEGGAAYTPENLQSFVSSIPAPVDPGIAGALPGGQGTTPLSFTDQLNALFQANLGRLPDDREASIYSKDFGGTFSPELEAAFMSRSTEEMGNRQKGIKEAADAAAKTETAKTTAPGVYQPTYTSYRQEGQAPFGGYYAQPGIGPYGGVFGVGTEQFEQQSDPFSGAQARARSLINNRLTPLTDNVPIDPRPPAPFGGYVAANDVTPNPFAYRQTLSPNTLAALAAEATPASEAAASEAPMRRGGYINQGITAVRR